MAGRARSLELLESERRILHRIAVGDPLPAVLEELIAAVERPSGGEMLGSILLLSEDGRHLLHGAAPSLPADYNDAIHGLELGAAAGSCGTAAFTGKPVYVTDIAADPLWANFRELASKHGLRACWSTPIHGTDGALIGTFANYYREPRSPTERDLEVIAMVTQTAAIAAERHRIEVERRRAEEQHLLLLHELNHRVKNLFTLTNALVTMSARSAKTPEEMSKTLQGRLFALSRAHELVQPGLRKSGSEFEGRDAPLPKMLEDILSPYAPRNREQRIEIAGPEVAIRPNATTSVALVLHELATNAAKYGALSDPEGRVAVTWEMGDAALELSWCESGGPDVAPPQSTGFGTLLARRSVEAQLGGKIEYDWAADGLRVRIALPLSKVTVPTTVAEARVPPSAPDSATHLSASA